MAYLVSKHDLFHIHKLIGFICLFHFIYRIYLVFIYGNAFFNNIVFDTCCVILHLILNITSFYFVLNKNRYFNKPIIWTEFRLHNLIFVSRHVICFLNNIIMPTFWSTYNLNIIVIILTILLADIITNKYGSLEDRTTNKMPYPETLEEIYIKLTKLFYSSSQMGATCFALYGDKTLCFTPIIGLQLAPFMMTLIKKNIIATKTYHLVYSIGLLINYPIIICLCLNFSIYNQTNYILIGICNYTISKLRFTYKMNKYISWILSWLFCLLIKNVINLNNYYIINLYILQLIIIFIYTCFTISWIFNYKSYYINTNLHKLFYNNYLN